MKTDDLSKVSEMMLVELSGVNRASENTIEAYRRDILQFRKFCEENKILSINSIKERHIRLFVMSLSEYELEKSSISRKLSVLRRLFNFAVRNDIIETNPISNISRKYY